MPKRTKKLSRIARPALKIEALEQRQLLATGFTAAQGQEFSDIVHPNGNVYDQVLLKTSAITVMNDPGQITRVSFLDLQGDIVQAEFGGAGSLSISLDNFSGAAEATKYNQPGVEYVTGLASFTIQGSDSSTNFTVFSVGTETAHNKGANPIFEGGLTGGDNLASVQRVTIVADPGNPNGSTFGGIRAGNALFSGESGVVGITAANVQIQDVVVISELNAAGTALPTLVFGGDSQFGAITVAGGGLISDNGMSINNTGSYEFGVTLTAGESSSGTELPAQDTSNEVLFSGANPFASVNNVFTLTTGVDTIPGLAGVAGTTTNGNDTINATLNDAAAGTATFSALDSINGGKGLDTINILDLDAAGSALPAGVAVMDVETVNLRAAGVAALDVSAWTGVTALNVTQAGSAAITVPGTTALTISGVTGAVVADGGSTVDVGSSGTTVEIGATTAPTGDVSVSHSKQGANSIDVDGKGAITVTASGRSTGAITIGASTKATDTVMVAGTGAASTDLGADVTLGAIAATGGTTLNVVQSAGSTTGAAADTTNFTVTQGAVTVTGTADTTSVTVVQDAAVTKADAVTAAAGTKETAEVTFVAMAGGDTIIINGLTFTASKALTASQAAAAFANLAASATHGTSPAGNGVYSGTFSADYSSGAASSSKVTFTAGAVGDKGDIADGGGTATVAAVVVDGKAATAAVTGKMGVVGGTVTIDGSADNKITTANLTGFGAGSTIDSDALATLTLTKSNEDLTITNAVATTLNLTVDAAGVTGGNTAEVTAPTYTTVNLMTTGTNSWVDLTAAAAKTLVVSGSKVVNLSGSTLGALTTVTVTETAGVTLPAGASATITSVNASGTTGAVTASIDPTTATYTGSAGADTLTLTAAAPTKAIDLGAGNDSLTLAAGTTTSTSDLNGGDGTDTLVMFSADAAAASAATTFETKIAGFERLSTKAFTADGTVNLDNLDDISYVITAGDGGFKAKFTNMANDGTISVGAGTGSTIVTMKDATGASDSLNVIASAAATGTVDIAGVETVNLSGSADSTVTLKAGDLTTLNVTGSDDITLVLDAATDSLTLVDASALTGTLTATTNGVVVQTIKGGSAADTLTANFQGDILMGNGGNDTLSVGGESLVSLTGGAGADIFNVGAATTNVNSYSTIMDLEMGDRVRFTAGAADFLSAQISLDPSTAVFQDYANAAINSSDTGDVTWFQYNGNTYVIENVSNAASFVNGTDVIVKFNGLVDLSTAAFSSSDDTLLII